MLFGRENELARLAALLEEARRGRAGALAVIGDPGVGKTALLAEARARGADLLLLEATGVENESELPFATLHELLSPLAALLSRIPPAQARAVAAALSLEEGVPDVLAVAAGTLSLIVEAAEDAPVLIVLDDAQWFDGASAQALAFAARRLKAEPAAVLVAFRPETAPAFAGLPRLDLHPLGPADARSLVATRPARLSAADEARILTAAEGNPLVLLELPVELADGLPQSSTHHERLERAFARRVSDLPASARFALLLAAAEPNAKTVHAASQTREATKPLAPAEAAGLVTIRDGAVVFRHPVVRSLVYSRATAGERAEAHRVLAAVLEGDADRDRRAWHLGAAAEDVDEEIAALLEQTAGHAIARGGHAASARALERAARLSPDHDEKARRLRAAARSERRGGDVAKARALIAEGLTLTTDPLLRFDLLFDQRAMSEWTDAREPESALQTAIEDPLLDDERRVKLLELLATQRINAFDAAGAVALAPELERGAALASTDRGPRERIVAGIAYLLAGNRSEAIRCFRTPGSHPAQATMAAFDYMSLEWYDELRASLADTLAAARQTGNLHQIIWIRSCVAHLELRHGRLSAADGAASEALQLGDVLGDPKAPIACAAIAGIQAWRGGIEACTTNARRAAASAVAAHDRFPEGLAHGALALLALGRRRPADAIAELEPLASFWATSTVRDPAATPFIPDLIEAYALEGSTDQARALLDRFAPLASSAGNIWMQGACARCEGMLATAEGFEKPFARALTLIGASPYRLDLARVQLAFGERLRRAGGRGARIQLQAAHEAFAAAGATLWQERAAGELRATGAYVSPESAPQLDLTPQERAIATLVAEGKSNKEVAAAVYLSPKTVEYHLANTFRKLNIHSRRDLARLLSGDN